MEGLAWEWGLYYSQPALRPPSVTKILYDLERRELAKPIFVCLHCATESQTQQAMAGHCRKHVRAGMAKGTVDHVKYYPDHTYSFLCNGRKLKKPHAPIPAQQAIPQPPNQQIYQEPAHRYNRILPYTGSTMGRSPWLQYNGPNMQGPTLAAPMMQHSHVLIEGSSSSPFGRVMIPNHNVVGRGTTLSFPPPVIDLTLRLGPNARSISENPMQGTSFRF
ncbi:hypothetical protein HU200_002925 [Digitaria exilis]|uniref:Uncharacterized protein n=1 Tax=Digitaria exilis TaxID=1010633 RepID=A0A835KV60_9POAL|nr:hypothetical protein HU200_002925 [Digitaria exilis]